MPTDDQRPSPRELVRAFRTLKRLTRVIGATSELRDMDGSSVWEGLVEARRMLAVATAGLGRDDAAYAEAWDRMMDFDSL